MEAALVDTPVEDSERSASMGWPEWVDALVERVGDRLNPILVKETRQTLKSKQFTIWFVLLLIACWIVTFGGIALIGPSIYYISAGGYLLYAYYFVLALPLVVVIPFTAFRSLSSEQEENTRDLLEVSSLSSRKIINGKLGSAMLQMILYLAVIAPCIAFTYLLRGVDAVAILLVLSYTVVACVALSAVGLMLAATTRQKHGQVFLSVLFAGALFGAFGLVMTGAGTTLAIPQREEGFWWFLLAILSLLVTTFFVVHQAATALTTFASANRSTGVRLALLFQHTVFLAWIIGFYAAGLLEREVNTVFMLIAAIYWFSAGAVMSGENPVLSERVRRDLPQSLLGRVVTSWFYPGPWSGYVFCVANLSVVALVCLGGLTLVARRGATVTEEVLAVGLIWAYAASYLAIGRFVISLLRRVAPITLLGCFLVQVLIVLGASVAPFGIDTLLDRVRVTEYTVLQLPSPVWTVASLLDGQYSVLEQFGVGVGVFSVSAILLLISLSLAGREARQQRIAKPMRVAEDDRELSPDNKVRPTNPWGDLPREESLAPAVEENL